MKKLFILKALVICSLPVIAQKLPDTTKQPKVYWSDLIRLQNYNNEITRRYHKEHIDALKRDTLDMFSSEIGSFIPIIYKRTYPDTTKKR